MKKLIKIFIQKFSLTNINYANIIITELLNIINIDLSNLTTYSPTELIRLKI